MPSQCASSILMVRPASFGFNDQTALTNSFQNVAGSAGADLQQKALKEFNAAIERLQQEFIDVIVVDDTPLPAKPDAIFPNNWICCHHDGRVFTFPMQAPNRRTERRGDVITKLAERFSISGTIRMEVHEKNEIFLEGTGSVVLDHISKKVYASLSLRTNEKLVNEFTAYINYTPVVFHSSDIQGKEIYHTNVMMSVGEKFAIICSESITDNNERNNILKELRTSGKEIIKISQGQLNRFAGNVLGVKNKNGKHYLLMSAQAFEAYTPAQLKLIQQSAKPLPVNISSIETCAGGSMRCMVAEIFLPLKSAHV